MLLLLNVTGIFGQVNQNIITENSGKLKMIISKSQNSGDNVHCSLEDRKGNLWFATTADGVFRYDGQYFTHFTTKDGLNSDNTFAIYEDRKGKIWFGTDKGLCIYDKNAIKPFAPSMVKENYIDHFTNKPATAIFVNSIIEDKNGLFWFGAENGIFCFDGKKFTRFIDNMKIDNPNKFVPKLVLSVLEDKKGNIWFTTRAEGIYRFDGKKLHNYKPDNEEWFRGLLEDKAGNIWIGRRYKGVFKFDGKTFKNVKQCGIFDSLVISQIVQDKKGKIWFATQGLWSYDGKKFHNVSGKNDFQNPDIWCILEDRKGYYWIGTRSTGLYKYDGKSFIRFSQKTL